MQFSTLNASEYEAFVNNHFSHYTQSKAQFEFRNQNQQDVHLVGVKDNNNHIIAACLLTEARSMRFFKYFYTHRGPVMDFSNDELVSFFFKNLTRYLKKKNCLFVLVDPYVIHNIRNHSGNILESKDNSKLFSTMKKLGYHHGGFTVGYSNKSQIRWLSVLDLKDNSLEDILNNMEYKTRRNIKKTEEMGVKVRTLDISETSLFYNLFHMAEEKHGFSFRDEAYFKQIQRMYEDQSCLKLAYIELDTYLNTLLKSYEQEQVVHQHLKTSLESNPNSKKTKTKVNESTRKLTSIQSKIDEARHMIEEHGNVLNLASALYIYNNHEVYYLSSGSDPRYNRFMGAYKLQWEMIKFAKEHHIDRYNFYGITGDFSEDAEDAGVIKFKKGFNAHVEELVGDFTKPVKPFMYKIYKIINR